MPLLPETKGPRSPLRVAVITFGAVCLLGFLVGMVVLGANGNLSDEPYARGEKIGQALTPIAAAAAVIAYVVQKKRISAP